MNIFEGKESYDGKNADKNIHNMQTYIPILVFQNLQWEKKRITKWRAATQWPWVLYLLVIETLSLALVLYWFIEVGSFQ